MKQFGLLLLLASIFPDILANSVTKIVVHTADCEDCGMSIFGELSVQNTRPHMKCQPETEDLIDDNVKSKPPIGAYITVLGEKTGLERPKDLKQCQNRKYNQNKAKYGPRSTNLANACVKVVNMMTDSNNPKSQFIQKLFQGQLRQGQPDVVLYHNDMMALARACVTTDSRDPTVLCSDVTFNVGTFFLTQVVFECKCLEVQGTNETPTFIAAQYLHFGCTYEDFLPFYENLSMRLSAIKSFTEETFVITGSDQERALVNGMTNGFKKQTIHVTCCKHLKEGVSRNLTKVGVLSKKIAEIESAIFNKRNGLISLRDEVEYDERFLEFRTKYSSDFQNDAYLAKMKQVIWDYVITPCMKVSENLANWMNQRGEAANSAVKTVFGHKLQTLDMGVSVLTDYQNGQLADFKSAITNEGRFRLKGEYKKFEVAAENWNRWSMEKREAHIRKLLKALTTPDPSERPDGYVASDEGMVIKDKSYSAKKPGQKVRSAAERSRSKGKSAKPHPNGRCSSQTLPTSEPAKIGRRPKSFGAIASESDGFKLVENLFSDNGVNQLQNASNNGLEEMARDFDPPDSKGLLETQKMCNRKNHQSFESSGKTPWTGIEKSLNEIAEIDTALVIEKTSTPLKKFQGGNDSKSNDAVDKKRSRSTALDDVGVAKPNEKRLHSRHDIFDNENDDLLYPDEDNSPDNTVTFKGQSLRKEQNVNQPKNSKPDDKPVKKSFFEAMAASMEIGARKKFEDEEKSKKNRQTKGGRTLKTPKRYKNY